MRRGKGGVYVRPKRLTPATHEVIQPFWSPDGRRIGYLADPRPEAGLLEQPQLWSIPAGGGGATKLAELKGEIAGAAYSPQGRLAYVGLDDPSFSGSTNLGLWVKDGSRTRRLGEELDRTFLFIVIGDLIDFGALAPVPVLWPDEDNVVRRSSSASATSLAWNAGTNTAAKFPRSISDPIWSLRAVSCTSISGTVSGIGT